MKFKRLFEIQIDKCKKKKTIFQNINNFDDSLFLLGGFPKGISYDVFEIMPVDWLVSLILTAVWQVYMT